MKRVPVKYAKLAKRVEELWRAFQRGDPAIEAAKLAANFARREQEARRLCSVDARL